MWDCHDPRMGSPHAFTATSVAFSFPSLNHLYSETAEKPFLFTEAV